MKFVWTSVKVVPTLTGASLRVFSGCNAQVTFCLCPAVIGWGQDPCNGKYDQWPMTNDPSRISCTYLLFWWIIMDYISRAAVTINAVFSFCPVQIHEKKMYQWPQWAHRCLASLGRSLKSKCNAWLVTWNAELQWGRDFYNPQEIGIHLICHCLPFDFLSVSIYLSSHWSVYLCV